MKVLQVENLFKCYNIGALGTGTLSHDVNRIWYRVRGKEDPYLKVTETNDRTSRNSSGYVWAINDCSFEVNNGEILGVIGKNGAGKSTLLKLLSKVTSPTKGKISYKGRISSLLEVGTGFNPELTGRENIYLNGAILGMSKKQINNRINEIISFAGVEKYIDTPIKRYSSGMIVRLGFAVAAHLDSEILIIDEVLAVGDIEFQNKAIGQMEKIAKGQNRTVIFVSHNMETVERLCTRCLVMNNGKIVASGNPSEMCNFYLEQNLSNSNQLIIFPEKQDDFYFVQAEFLNDRGEKKDFRFDADQNINIKVTYRLRKSLKGLTLGINIGAHNITSLWGMSDWDVYPELFEKRDAGLFSSVWTIPANTLKPGKYSVALGAAKGSSYYYHPEPFTFEVINKNYWRLSAKYFGLSGGPLGLKMDVTYPQTESIES